MRLGSISLRNLRVRLVATVLTTLSIVLATALYAAILTMSEQTEQRYKGSVGGYQAVVGPKDASQLELVLNTIFNVGDAPALFPLQVAMDLRTGKVSRRGQVHYAIPQAAKVRVRVPTTTRLVVASSSGARSSRRPNTSSTSGRA